MNKLSNSDVAGVINVPCSNLSYLNTSRSIRFILINTSLQPLHELFKIYILLNVYKHCINHNESMFSFFICFSYETLLIVIFVS